MSTSSQNTIKKTPHSVGMFYMPKHILNVAENILSV